VGAQTISGRLVPARCSQRSSWPPRVRRRVHCTS